MARILIADDSRVQVHLFSSCLADRGFEVLVAVDALQTWMIALQAAPDAIILDVNMPGGSGVDVLRKLRLSSRTMQIPVVVVSGSNEPEVQRVIAELGVAAFLQKPVDLDQFGNLLVQLLRPRASVVPDSKDTSA